MKKTRLSAVASLLAAGVMMGGCLADVGGESESKGGAAQGPSVGGAKQALGAPLPGTWTNWQKLELPVGVGTEKSPAISSRGNGTFDVFVLGTDNNIYMRSYAYGGFGPWANLGGAPAGLTFVSGPDAVSSDANSFAVVAMADNGHYFLNTWTDASGSAVMSGWKQIMGKGLTNGPGPGISSFGPGRLAIYGFGPDSQTWESRQDPAAEWGWSWPESLGSPQNAPLASSVTSVSWNSNKVDLFVRGSDNSLWTRGWDGTGWNPQNDWRKLGGQFTSGFGAASWGFGHLDVFGVGADSQLYQIQYNSGWSAFMPVEAPFGLAGDSAPDAVSSGRGRIDLIVRGSDNQPWVRSFTSSTGGIRRTPPVASGHAHSLAVKSDGTVWAWGTNDSGQLGDGTQGVDRSPPVLVSGLTDVVSVSASGSNSLAVQSDGTLWAWGSNSKGQLGDGPTTDSLTPKPVSGLTGVVAVAAGNYHSLAVKSDGTLWAWGGNFNGQLGDGTTTDRSTPKPVPGLTGVVAVAAGNNHSLAVKSDGTLWAWGSNLEGQLGDRTRKDRSAPTQVLTDVVAVAAGNYHSLAVKSDGTLWAWGWNFRGQLGDGTMTDSLTPKQVPNLTGFVAVAEGLNHSLAIKSDGTLWGWGSNSGGQLGDGTTEPDTRTPLPVNLPGGIMAMDAGNGHSLAVKSDGTLWTWGNNSRGQLGDGTTTSRSTPGQLMGLPVRL